MVDLSKVYCNPDGVLCADMLTVTQCESCDNIHFYLKTDGATFAAIGIEPESAFLIACKIIEIHDHIRKRQGRAPRQ